MEWVETTGSTVEAAKDAALDQLGVDEQDAEFEILEEAKSGLFGLTRREARVRARVRPTSPRPKVERRDRRRPKADAAKRGEGRSAKGARKSPAAAAAKDDADDGAMVDAGDGPAPSAWPSTPTPERPRRRTTDHRGGAAAPAARRPPPRRSPPPRSTPTRKAPP